MTTACYDDLSPRVFPNEGVNYFNLNRTDRLYVMMFHTPTDTTVPTVTMFHANPHNPIVPTDLRNDVSCLPANLRNDPPIVRLYKSSRLYDARSPVLLTHARTHILHHILTHIRMKKQ